MAERALPLTALAAATRECFEVSLAALPPCVRLIIRGDPISIGMAEPEPCRATIEGDRALLWLGPDEFLLLAPDGATPTPGVRAIVDVSHRDTAMSVSGPRAAWAINAFCPLDLHLSEFPVGMCTRTVFGKASILLWRTETNVFRLETARSFAPYVWACLEEARREFVG
jgi:heterotetrameric sarcosine oxidase gamma subunit